MARLPEKREPGTAFREAGTDVGVTFRFGESSETSQIKDRCPDFPRQAVTVRDNLVWCRALPAHFLRVPSNQIVTACRTEGCAIRSSGAIPAAYYDP